MKVKNTRATEQKVTLTPNVRTGKVTVTVPPFRYHTMVVFRFAKED